MTELNELKKIIHAEKLKEFLYKNKSNLRSFLWQWRDTASELDRKSQHVIQNKYAIYNELPDAELNIDRVMMYLSAILSCLSNEDLQRQFINSEIVFARLTQN